MVNNYGELNRILKESNIPGSHEKSEFTFWSKEVYNKKNEIIGYALSITNEFLFGKPYKKQVEQLLIESIGKMINPDKGKYVTYTDPSSQLPTIVYIVNPKKSIA